MLLLSVVLVEAMTTVLTRPFMPVTLSSKTEVIVTTHQTNMISLKEGEPRTGAAVPKMQA
jgi:hypothetical protein